MRVLIADKFEAQGVQALKDLGCEIKHTPDLSASDLPAELASCNPDCLIVRSTKVQPPALDASADLKLVIRAGAGYDTIDTAHAASKGIAVCNCPGMNAAAVAELAMALLLCADRLVPQQTADLKAGNWNKKLYAKAKGLKGRTLLVIGVGSIGRELIRRAQAFGMHCIAHSINMTPERAADLGVGDGGNTREHLYAALATADAVSLHVAANAESEHLADKKFFDAMKEGASFINTSRGSVVDESALADAIRSKSIRAGLDVYNNEPAEGTAQWSTPLADLPNVATTHHVGASTEQAQLAVAEEVVRIVAQFMNDRTTLNRVNEPATTAQ